jgi:hypothetical protein
MDDLQYLDSLITDEKIIKEIEDTTHYYYKLIFNHVRIINTYNLEIKELEKQHQKDLANHSGNNSIRTAEQLGNLSELKTKRKDSTLNLNFDFEKLYGFANKNNYYWCNSDLQTYKFYFEGFKRNFKRLSNEHNKIEFLKHELQHFLDYEKSAFIIKADNKTNFIHRTKFLDYFAFIDYYPFLFNTNKLKIQTQNNNIIEFLKSEIENEGYSIKIKKNKVTIKPKSQTSNIIETTDEEVIQKSNLPELNLLERFHLLQRLGVIDLIEKSTDIKGTKNMLLGLTMNCSSVNARKLLNNNYKYKNEEQYKKLLSEAKSEVDEIIYRNKINTKG